MRLPLLACALIGALFCAPPLEAQRLSLRVAGVETDTAYLAIGDQVPFAVLGKTAAGGTVTPTSARPVGTLHCTTTVTLSPTSWRVGSNGCWPGDVGNSTAGWFTVEAIVSGARVRDSVYVTPPVFGDLGSPRALCLTWDHKSLWYVATDTVIALAYRGADRLIATNFLPASAGPSYAWSGARLVYEMAAMACLPGYRVRDITRTRGVKWASADTAAATVASGVVTVKRRGPVVVSVNWSP
jgi:hypothetical protein